MPTLLVLCSCPDETSAHALAGSLVDRRLAACVNILPAMQSVYRWEGRVEQASEILLLAKTTSARFAEIKEHIARMHPYKVPEVLAFAAADGLDRYLGWIDSETAPDGDSP